jgi:hypothetical protein
MAATPEVMAIQHNHRIGVIDLDTLSKQVGEPMASFLWSLSFKSNVDASGAPLGFPMALPSIVADAIRLQELHRAAVVAASPAVKQRHVSLPDIEIPEEIEAEFYCDFCEGEYCAEKATGDSAYCPVHRDFIAKNKTN